MTFEDSKANTGDSGSSVRSTQEWLDIIESARDFAASKSAPTLYSEESGFSGISPTSPSRDTDATLVSGDSTGQLQPPHRHLLRRGQSDDDSLKGRKRFSKRHSKNGLAAVF